MQLFLQLMDKCMAPDTSGDGTGCDNMTCLIVLLNQVKHLELSSLILQSRRLVIVIKISEHLFTKISKLTSSLGVLTEKEIVFLCDAY